jgi:putative tricarboxylic transport membrane protein
VKINDAVFGALLLALGVGILWHVQSFPKIPGQDVGPGLFPGTIAAALIACAILLIRGGVRDRAGRPWIELLPWVASRRHAWAFVSLVGTAIALILLSNSVGFLIVAPLALFAMFIAFGVRPVTAAVIAVVGTAVIWYAFYKLLRVPLPWGVLERFAF